MEQGVDERLRLEGPLGSSSLSVRQTLIGLAELASQSPPCRSMNAKHFNECRQQVTHHPEHGIARE